MTGRLPPWYHFWHSWSPWDKANLQLEAVMEGPILQHQWRTPLQFRWCVDCYRVQFRVVP